MTNLQFYLLLSPAVGSLVLVVLAWLHQNQRLSDLRADTNRHIDDLRSDTNRQFADVNRQFADVNRQFADVHRQFDDVNRQFVEMRAALATLSADYRTFYGMEQKLEGRVDELSKRT